MVIWLFEMFKFGFSCSRYEFEASLVACWDEKLKKSFLIFGKGILGMRHIFSARDDHLSRMLRSEFVLRAIFGIWHDRMRLYRPSPSLLLVSFWSETLAQFL